MNDYALRLNDVYKSFKKKDTGERIEVLKGVNLDVENGKIFSILGGSGSGKSVLMRGAVKASGYRYDSGTIELLGENITNYNEKQMNEMRVRLSLCFQEGALFNSIKVSKNIGHSLYEHDRRFWINWLESRKITSAREQRQIERFLGLFDPLNDVYIGGKNLYDGKSAEEIVDIIIDEKCRKSAEHAQLDYDKVKDKMPGQLSGGMKKRVGLARGLATDPELCILDEPVTGLDPERTRLISEKIKEYTQTGTTFVIISHSIPSTKYISLQTGGEVGLLYGGKIVFEGLWEDFKATKEGKTEKSKQKVEHKETGEIITLDKVITDFCGLEEL